MGQYKVSIGCMDCGFDGHPDALQFDHVRGEKLFDIARGISSHGQEAVESEMEKCDIVCANCHAIRTAIRRNA